MTKLVAQWVERPAHSENETHHGNGDDPERKNTMVANGCCIVCHAEKERKPDFQLFRRCRVFCACVQWRFAGRPDGLGAPRLSAVAHPRRLLRLWGKRSPSSKQPRGDGKSAEWLPRYCDLEGTECTGSQAPRTLSETSVGTHVWILLFVAGAVTYK